MMTSRTIITAAVAAAFAFALPAYAAGDKGSAGSSSAGATKDDTNQEFRKLDKNKDGSISKDEAKGSEHEKDFSKYDKNNDGKLSKEEFSAAERAEKSSTGSSSTSGKSSSSSGSTSSPSSSTSGSKGSKY